MRNRDRIPTIGEHRGVGLHDHQDEERLATVRREIDAVLDLTDPTLLVETCADVTWSPEARLTAAAKLKAMHQIAAEDRKVRPTFDLAYVAACTAGLDSVYWRSPWHYGSLLDPGRAPGEAGPVPRDVPLEDCR
ncbi:hypothetical protein DPM33_15135 [Mesorhizobium hawassense]|uniref:Uncharacterized protein n=1 Tax=Mesorhizobium hawassense TaxID=1209954 RepID=A0A330HQK2_9HYPH|nr:hypothetical protein [Mesorhizobium hawassense]RAZ90160.1 hypothetical protein DPM33_15135 [Mesorhizobium hawassense]